MTHGKCENCRRDADSRSIHPAQTPDGKVTKLCCHCMSVALGIKGDPQKIQDLVIKYGLAAYTAMLMERPRCG